MNEPLSYFVKYIETIKDIDLDTSLTEISKELNVVINILQKSAFNKDAIDKLHSKQHEIVDELKKFNQLVSNYKVEATAKLRNDEKSYLAESYKLYEDASTQDTPAYILDRALFGALIYKNKVKEYLTKRIQANSSWKYAGMFIRPEHGEFVNEMTASDPLYIVDDNITLLEPTKKLWNEHYQSRVRYNVINNSRSEIFKNFPKKQFGLIVAVDYFNYTPVEVIRNYFTELYELLMDGGIVVFTYNNCNLPIAVKNFEKLQYSYTPKSLIMPLLELIGFEIIEDYSHIESNVSWLEIKKPGKLSTIRGGQCLGRINV